MPGRPKKPTSLKLMTGTYRSDRDHTVDVKPTDELGKPPRHLNKEVKRCWNVIAKTAPPGVLGRHDRIAVEIASTLLSQFRDDPTSMTTARLLRLEVMLGRFGMNPSDRAKLSLPQPDDDGPNPWTDIAR